MKTTLTDNNLQPIYLGDKFEIHRHSNECRHCKPCMVICEIRENSSCTSGYGLHCVKTGELISNGIMAGGYSKV